ncbi:MAG: hypothetical protein RL360_664 [Bacteroidota bacterium]|jgi:hypothetical protein
MKVNLTFGRHFACSLSSQRGVYNSENTIPRLNPTQLIVSVSSFVVDVLTYMLLHYPPPPQ